MNYYNEFDPFAAQWLRNLILAGHLPRGDVDERSIAEVSPDDLRPYTQCHFFAGIGGWSLALEIAGWPADRPVWTGSCPCQPFSAAGKQAGQDDARHLWPSWKNLIVERRPATVFGEQVASAIAHGWLDEVAVDLEAEAYALAAAILPACAAGAFHRRDRLWFVAHAANERRDRRADTAQPQGRTLAENSGERPVADTDQPSPGDGNLQCGRTILRPPCDPADSPLADAGRGRCRRQGEGQDQQPRRTETFGTGDTGSLPLVDPESIGRREGRTEPELRSGRHAVAGASGADLEWLTGPDGKARPVKPGIRLLAHGISARVGRLRAYGNAIYPPAAAAFIQAFDECRP